MCLKISQCTNIAQNVIGFSVESQLQHIKHQHLPNNQPLGCVFHQNHDHNELTHCQSWQKQKDAHAVENNKNQTIIWFLVSSFNIIRGKFLHFNKNSNSIVTLILAGSGILLNIATLKLIKIQSNKQCFLVFLLQCSIYDTGTSSVIHAEDTTFLGRIILGVGLLLNIGVMWTTK